jgi:DMSO/TMAO reductase YedYZ molybdopterin-dependent catalytic subunit
VSKTTFPNAERLTMSISSTRRDLLKGSLTLAGLGMLGIPDWALAALAEGETLVPFTDLPPNINLTPAPDRRIIDIRNIDGLFTPKDQFFTTQHYGHPVVDPAAFRLRIAGLVDRPTELSLDELRKMKSTELIFGFECSGNRRPLQGLTSNGRWTGVPLRAVLERAGIKKEAQEVVFFGADHGDEEVEFRGQVTKVDQQFGRSLLRDKALSPEPLLVYAMNGEPLTRHQGFPLRLLVPGWYGVSNVKWLSEIHVQEDRYLGKFQARWYRTLKGETVNGEVKWKETAISTMHLKSFIARVSRDGSRHKVFGIVLNDGTPIKSVEVRVDDGPWQPATLDPATTANKYSWKQFNYTWNGATPGEHTVVSRVTDVTGKVQPTTEDLEVKKTFLEDNSQHPRKVMIA